MKKGKLIGKIFGIALVGLMIGGMLGGLPTLVSKVEASPATICVPDDYSTIQAAVNASSSGDTIIVRDGTYIENVDINKDHLTIQSENGAEATIVQAANPNDSVFEVTSDYVNINGFTMKGAHTCYAGIFIYHAGHCNIFNNICENNGLGILLGYSDNNILHGNVMVHNRYNFGVGGDSYVNNIDTSNTVDGRPIYYLVDVEHRVIDAATNAGYVAVVNSTDIIVKDLTLANNGHGVLFVDTYNSKIENINTSKNEVGLRLIRSGKNIITTNYVSNNFFGIEIDGGGQNTIINNTVNSSTNDGIVIWTSDNNTLIGNTVNLTLAKGGITLGYADSNIITSNNLSSNKYGIYFEEMSQSNKIHDNNILNNSVGINLNGYHPSSENFIYYNDFIDNVNNVDCGSSTNIWQSPREITYTYKSKTFTNYLGNHWDEYTGSDADGDGIGETPCPIDSDADNYPLVDPFENYKIGEDTTPPMVSSSSPQNGQPDVAIDTVVTAAFSEAMDSSTITTESFTLAGSVVSGTVEYDPATYTATFTPDADLDYDHEYTATLSTAITDVAGNPLAEPYTWSFTTLSADVYWLAKAIMSEASIGTREERIAVGWTVLNRLDSGEFGGDIEEIVKGGYAYNQEPTEEIIALAEELLERQISDPTEGATHFFSPISMPWEGDEGEFIERLGRHFDEFDTGGGLHEVPGIEKRVYFPSWTRTLTWVGDLDNVRRAYFMFYRPNQPPVASFTCSQENPFSGDAVSFDASSSYDPDGTIVSYEWNFGDGETATGPQVTHRFRGAMGEAKECTVELRIEDDKGATNSNTHIVTVYRLKRYIPVYSSLCQFLPLPVPTIIEVVVYYNWVDEKDGQDEYIVSEVHLGNEESLNFALYMFSIEDEGEKVWSKIHKGVGKEDVSFTYPFGVPRDCVKSIGDEHFEGLLLGPDSELNFVVHGVELGLELRPSFFRVSRTIELGPGKQTELPPVCPEGTPGVLAAVASPVELRVYDFNGNVTGLVDGEIREEIPNSMYGGQSGTCVIFSPEDIDSNRYEAVGTDEGTYGLEITSVEDGEAITFTASDIPTTDNATHEYTIDWEALSEGEEGVTVQIDSDGDGEFEDTFTADEELSQDEFVLRTATTIDFDPDTLNLKSKEKFVTVYIELPTGYDVSQIDVSSITLNGTILALAKPTQVGDYDSDSIPDLMVKFDGDAVQDLLTPGSQVEITVTGEVAEIGFEGSDTIRVINN